MRRGPKPAKAKVEAKLPAARKSPKDEGSRVSDLEKRLVEAQGREAEAREQQAATSEILRAISEAQTDAQPVFDAIARSTVRLCEAARSTVWLPEGDLFRAVARCEMTPEGRVVLASSGEVLEADSLPSRAVRERQILRVNDAPENPTVPPKYRERARIRGYRSAMAVPMVREGRAVGVITVVRPTSAEFSDQQVDLVKTFADQAVIAIENVRLFTELQEKNRAVTEALERQTATADILRVISQSPTDVQPVFDTIVESAVRLCDAARGNVYTFDGELLHHAAEYNARPGSADFTRATFPRRPGRDLGVGRVILDRDVVHIPDVERDPEFSQALARARGLRSVLAVPLLREGSPIGVIAVTRHEPGPFSKTQIELLKTFADQAVIAIENVRLFKELQEKNQALTEALEQQTATGEILRVISSSPMDVQPTFETIAAAATTLCAAENAGVFLFDGRLIRFAAHHRWTAEDLDAISRLFPRPPGRGSVTARAILTRAVAHVPDLLNDPEYEDTDIIQAGFRAILSVPMLRDGQPIGAINVARRKPLAFTDTQIALLKTFANQAVIAIENVRLFTETKEALEQQRASSEILGVISSSPTDVQPVFDVIVQSAVRLCGGVHSNVYLVEDGLIHLVAHHNFSPAALEHLQRRFPMPASQGEGLATRVIREGILVHLRDAQTDPEVPETTRRTTQALGARSVLYVPMLRDRVGIGVIVVSRGEVKPFSDKEITLIRTFADQAVIAIENVRLFKELQEKNRALTEAHAQVTEALQQRTATSEILRVISSSPTDVQPVFDAIAESAQRLCNAFNAAVFRFDGDLVHFAAHRGFAPDVIDVIRDIFPGRPSRESATSRAILLQAVVHIPDVREDPEYRTPRWADAMGIRSVLSVPMLREGRPIGTITVNRVEPGPFSDKHVALLETFADQAVIAIENVRLFKELQTSNRELTTALDTQTATADILRVISRSQTDVQPVFEAIVESAMRLLRAHVSVLTRVVGVQLELAAYSTTSEEGDAAVRAAYPLPLDSKWPHVRSARERIPFNIADTETDPRVPEALRAIARARGFRSLVTVPLLHRDEALGAIAVARHDAGGFTDDEIALLQTFADQAVIAIENARLLSELQERTQALTHSVEQLTALGDVGRAVSSTLDLETVLTTIVSRAVELSGLDGGVVFEYDEAAEEFVQRVATETGGVLAEARRTTRIRKGEGVLGRTAITLEPIQVPDITVPGAHEGRLRENLIESGIRAVLAVPMVYEGRLIGGLGVTRNRPGEFPAETIELMRTFATQSALAIQNARLFRELADKSHQLEVAGQHKSEFLANMSHELRTPLNAIIGFSEVLAEGMFGEVNEKQTEYLRDILESGQHLLSLINDILDLSKIEAGRMELELTDFDLGQAILNALTLVRERAGRRGIALHQAVDQRLGQIRGDERKIKQVLLNLMSNALKFTPEGGRVDVRASLVDGLAEISVTDTGVGIAPEDQEAVFEEFRQVGTAAKKVEGTGLGLALSRKFIELHGGRIWVKSQVGMGSTFTFTIPVRRGA